MRKYKRIIAMVTLVMLLISSLTYAATVNIDPSGMSDAELLKALLEHVAPTSRKGKALSISTFREYRIIAYYKPYGDTDEKGERRYLGVDENDRPITNDLFTNDINLDNPLDDRDWITQNGNIATWKIAKAVKQRYYLINTNVIDDGEQTNITIAEILSKKGVGLNELMPYIQVMSPPTVLSSGSARLHHRYNGKVYYNTFNVPPMDSVKLDTIVETDEDEYSIEFGEDYVDVLITVEADINLKETPEADITKIEVTYEGDDREVTLKKSSYQYTKRFTRSELNIGQNTVNIEGSSSMYIYGEKITVDDNKNIVINVVSDAPKYLNAVITGKSVVEKNEDFELTLVINTSSTVASIKWYKDDNYISSYDGKTVIEDSISRTTKYEAEVTTADLQSARPEKIVSPLGGEHVDYIHCSFDIEKDIDYTIGTFGGRYRTKYDDNSYVEGKESEEYRGIEKYVVSLYDPYDDSKDTSFEVTRSKLESDRTAATQYIKNEIEDILEKWYTAEGDYTVGVSQYAYDEDGDYDTDFEFIKLHRKNPLVKPRTSIDVSDPFYPKEIDKDDSKTVEWSYSSSDGIPYQESIVSLYRINGAFETPVFENQTMVDRKLILNEDAGTELKIKVKVKDTNGAESDEKQSTWIVAGGKPNIDLTLNPASSFVDTNVVNLNPPEIEALFPTTYTKWEIADKDGVIIESGTGEIIATIQLDNRYDIGLYTATQYAENNLGNSASDTEQFNVLSTVDFRYEPNYPFEGELVKLTDLSKGVTNQVWSISLAEEPSIPLILDNELRFTRVPGTYNVTLEGDGLFEENKTHSSITKEVTFLDATPNAGFIIHDYKKMYKELHIEGEAPSLEATNNYLQSRYPILFNDEKTQFVIEPLDDEKNPDYTLNQYIKGVDREVLDGKVTFRAKSDLHIRFDKEGWYRASYKVSNALKESDWYTQEFYIAPELPIDIDLVVTDPIVFRNPNDELKATMTVTVNYNSPDNDLLDESSKLFLSYDFNRDDNYTNDGNNSAQYQSKIDERTLDYIEDIQASYEVGKVIYKITVDNPTKNLLGKFMFDYEAVEKPSIPNYTALGDVPIIKSNTYAIAEEFKIAFVDNQKPVISIETRADASIELYIIEESNNPLDVNMILEQLKLNKIEPTIYHIKRDGTVEILK